MIPKDLITIKYFLGKPWLKLFYHYVISDEDFFSEDEQDFLYHNSRKKFSIFNYIDKKFKYEGYYEFLLEYPSVEGYNHWKQEIFPLDANENEGTTDVKYNQNGYLCSWTGKDWKGLRRSSQTRYTYLDGSNSDKHWFEIGVKNRYNNNLLFPGPALSDYDIVFVSQVVLWIYIPPPLYSSMIQETYPIHSLSLTLCSKLLFLFLILL